MCVHWLGTGLAAPTANPSRSTSSPRPAHTMGDLEVAVHKAASALRAVCDSAVFGKAWDLPHAARASQELKKRVLSGGLRDISGTIVALSELLSDQHVVLQLLILSVGVRLLSKDLWDEEAEELSSDEDDEDEDAGTQPAQDAGAAAGSSSGPLEGKGADAVASFLMAMFQEENSGLRFKFTDLAKKLGTTGIWSLVQATNEHIEKGGHHTVVASGERPRTGGGIFLKLAKEKEAELKRQVALAAVANTSFKLRDYQQQAVDTISAKGGNWVLAAPTNTGKTAIFIELSRRMLAARPGGTVVVVVPTVSLVYQQCSAYQAAGFRPASGPTDLTQDVPAVDWFCGDKQLLPSMWQAEARRLGVIVIEAQSFSNLVQSGAASLAHIQLLVLDECHHTAKDHPYAKIMHSYSRVEPKPQVIGLSASPANGKSEAALELKLNQLLTLLCAQLYVVGEDEPMVQQVAPAPEQEELHLGPRAADGQVQEWLRHMMHLLSLDVSAALEAELGRPGVATTSAAAARSLLGEVPSVSDLVANQMDAYNMLCKWMNAAMEVARTWSLPNLGACVQVLEVLRRAEALGADIGYECSLQYLCQRCVSMSARTINPTNTVPVVVQPRHGVVRRNWLRDAPTLPASNTDVAAASDQQLAALYQHLATAPTPAEIKRQELNRQRLANLSPCADIGLVPSQLCRFIIHEFCIWTEKSSPLRGFKTREALKPGRASCDDPPPPAPTAHCQQLARAALPPLLPGGLTEAGHPKVWQLVKYLQRYQHKPEFHGIIFCKSRQGAHYLVEVLRAACLPPLSARTGHAAGQMQGKAQLHFIDDIALFVGHGSKVDDKSRSIAGAAAGGLVGAGDRLAARGMNVTQQHQALETFKKEGRRLLVATNAAEEGLDLPCCEFVVRFTPASSGIQMVQGRGRARKLGAHYMCLVQDPPPGALQSAGVDSKLHHKSKAEEANLKRVLNKYAVKPQ